MKRAWLAGASTLALGVALSAPAMAACDDVSDPLVPGVIVIECIGADPDGVDVDAGGDDVDIDLLSGATIENSDVAVANGIAVRVVTAGDVFFDAALDTTISAIGNGVRIIAAGDITARNSAEIKAGYVGILSNKYGAMRKCW